MNEHPNILFLMTDQMQAAVLRDNHVCKTPNLDELARRGVRFERAYTPNAICSPARASLMTGLLPHNHGVLTVTHVVDDDQSRLRARYPHWAQRLKQAGYTTGHFGKWHVDRDLGPDRFGWDEVSDAGWQGKSKANSQWSSEVFLEACGYRRMRFAGVTDVPPEQRGVGVNTQAGLDFLDRALTGDAPWACMVSVIEPHDPFICGREAFAQYDPESIELPASLTDEMGHKPGLYRRAQGTFSQMTRKDHQIAAACYYASVTEIDAQFGRLIDRIDRAGQLENTLVVLTTDHGEHLGAHGLYCKNFCASEEVYNIPLILSGPGVKRRSVTSARVGLQDLCPTLCDLAGVEPIENADSRSFASLLAEPQEHEARFNTGFAEYNGGRFNLTQRIYYRDDWKYVFNGFDYDELYNLSDDPGEMHNRIDDTECKELRRSMAASMWKIVRDTGDHSLYNTQYPILRLNEYGPLLAEEADSQ
jgi:arylsulfatase A-like enzyme